MTSEILDHMEKLRESEGNKDEYGTLHKAVQRKKQGNKRT